MPKIFEYFGLIFLFYSNEHTPIHVHVKHGELENKLEFVYKNGILKDILVKSIKGKKSLSDSMLKDAVKFARVKESEIINKWFNYFAKNKKPVCEKITKKL